MRQIRAATAGDVDAIHGVLAANAGDRSLFQQPRHQIVRTLGDFVVACDGDGGELIGCAALHWHGPDIAEILAVAVAPAGQGRGIGGALVSACVARAHAARTVWLATAKPGYFAKFGFAPMSRFALPPRVIGRKLRLVFQQPFGRWLPALFGRHTVMRLVARLAR